MTDHQDPVEHATQITLAAFERLGVVDGGQMGLLLPSHIRVRTAKGELERRPCMLMCLNPQRRVEARLRARQWATKLKLDPLREPDLVKGGGQDADIVRLLEQYEELAFAVRDAAPPYDQSYFSGIELWQAFYTVDVAADLYARLAEWERPNDPRFGDLSPDQTWETIARVAAEGTALPLAEHDGAGQLSCIIVMARAALRSPTCPSRWRSLLESRPGSASESLESSPPTDEA